MSQGSAPRQADLFRDTSSFVEPLVRPDSIHALLHRECHELFPDALFADLFADVGRRSVPPLVVAVVMVLQRLEGLWTARRSSGSRSTPAGSTPVAACRSMRRASPTPCSSTCGRGSPARSVPTGSSSARSRSRGRPGCWASGGCSTPPRCTTRSPPWTPSPSCGVRSGGCSPRRGSGSRRSAPGPPPRRRLPHRRQARRRLGRRRGAPRARRRARPRRGGRAHRTRGQAAGSAARRGRHAPRHGPRPGPRGGSGRQDPDRAAGGPRPGHQHGRPRGASRPQDRGPRLRRVQGPRRARPRCRARHRDRRHAGQRG